MSRSAADKEAIHAEHWAHLMEEVDAGKHPSATALAEIIIVCGVPANSRAALYVAKRLREHGAGRPRLSRQKILVTRARYEQMLNELRDWKASDPKGFQRKMREAGYNPDAAIHSIAQDQLRLETGRSPRTLQRILYGDLNAPE